MAGAPHHTARTIDRTPKHAIIPLADRLIHSIVAGESRQRRVATTLHSTVHHRMEPQNMPIAACHGQLVLATPNELHAAAMPTIVIGFESASKIAAA
jgi:hypothetical protein